MMNLACSMEHGRAGRSCSDEEVKRHRARLVLGWRTAREVPRVLSALGTEPVDLAESGQHNSNPD